MPPSDNHVIRATDLEKRFGYRWILRGVNLSVAGGEVVAVMGPNGAGKTTLLRLLSGLTRPSGGGVEAVRPLGLVGHQSMLYEALSAESNLRFYARLFGAAEETIEEMLQLVGLSDRRADRIHTFSRGMVQRLSIARALLARPRALLLDEPLNSLDEAGVNAIADILERLRRQGTGMVLVSHEFTAVSRLANRVAFLTGGTLSPPERIEGWSTDRLSGRYREVVWNA